MTATTPVAVSVFEGGPMHGRRVLGRVREHPAQPGDPVDLAADAVIPYPDLGGRYELTRIDGGEHQYAWQPDAEPGDAA